MDCCECNLVVDDAMESVRRLLSDRRDPDIKVDIAFGDREALAIVLTVLTEISSAALAAVAEQRDSTYPEAVEWVIELALNSRNRSLAAPSRGRV